MQLWARLHVKVIEEEGSCGASRQAECPGGMPPLALCSLAKHLPVDADAADIGEREAANCWECTLHSSAVTPLWVVGSLHCTLGMPPSSHKSALPPAPLQSTAATCDPTISSC